MRFATTIAAALLSSFAVAHKGTGHDVVPVSPHKNGKTCTVRALGNQTDDTPQILKAFKDCNHGGTVVFPKDQNYWIATRLNPVLYDVTIQWEGIWTVDCPLHPSPIAVMLNSLSRCRIISHIGVTILIQFSFKITMPDLSSQETAYILMDLAVVVFMEMEMLGIMWRKR